MRHAPAPGRRATRAVPEPVRQFQIRCGSGRIRLGSGVRIRPDPAKNRALSRRRAGSRNADVAPPKKKTSAYSRETIISSAGNMSHRGVTLSISDSIALKKKKEKKKGIRATLRGPSGGPAGRAMSSHVATCHQALADVASCDDVALLWPHANHVSVIWGSWCLHVPRGQTLNPRNPKLEIKRHVITFCHVSPGPG